ncbi:unnamed protein product [Amoebophrya sp. A25]|nr:unnamed protein product [Amoebophrya sp. A25]|eukprot:GSA25T00025928001.1
MVRNMREARYGSGRVGTVVSSPTTTSRTKRAAKMRASTFRRLSCSERTTRFQTYPILAAVTSSSPSNTPLLQAVPFLPPSALVALAQLLASSQDFFGGRQNNFSQLLIALEKALFAEKKTSIMSSKVSSLSFSPSSTVVSSFPTASTSTSLQHETRSFDSLSHSEFWTLLSATADLKWHTAQTLLVQGLGSWIRSNHSQMDVFDTMRILEAWATLCVHPTDKKQHQGDDIKDHDNSGEDKDDLNINLNIKKYHHQSIFLLHRRVEDVAHLIHTSHLLQMLDHSYVLFQKGHGFPVSELLWRRAAALKTCSATSVCDSILADDGGGAERARARTLARKIQSDFDRSHPDDGFSGTFTSLAQKEFCRAYL